MCVFIVVTTLMSGRRGVQGVSSLSCSQRHGVREAEGERPATDKFSDLEDTLLLSRCIAAVRKGARVRALPFFASACVMTLRNYSASRVPLGGMIGNTKSLLPSSFPPSHMVRAGPKRMVHGACYSRGNARVASLSNYVGQKGRVVLTHSVSS